MIFAAHYEHNTDLLTPCKVVMVKLLAVNTCLLTHPGDAEQHKQSFGVMFQVI